MYSAVLDTCVLWPSKQRDLLLSLAVEGLYRPLWSSAILEELEYSESEKLQGRGVDTDAAVSAAQNLVAEMTRSFSDALVSGWEPFDGVFGLPDPNDEHVVAAAVTGGASAIVTVNFKDFPSARIPEHIEIQDPPRFIANTVTVNPQAANRAVHKMIDRYTRPRVTIDELFMIFERRYGLVDAVATLRGAC